VVLLDYTYEQLLDRAFAKIPNLSAEKSDFKIPEVDSIIQGTKTIIRNFAQIADVARRSEENIAKYLTKELAAPVSVSEHTLKISTKVQAYALNEKIKKYFETYVICKECHKPDTHIEGMERGYEMIVCEACGARYTVKGF
jgi:translation initiation factor 2 subunit 2